MSNSHLQPSMAAETQSMFGDLLSHGILGTSLSYPGSGMTIPAFTTQGYVRNGSPTRLVYVSQGAAPVTLAGGDGTYWLALHHDTHTPVAGWTRQPGTHYLWCTAGTQPAHPPGGLVMASATVTGGNITTGDGSLGHPYQKVAFGGQGGALAFDTELIYDATNNILIGRSLHAATHPGDGRVAFYTDMVAAGGTNRWALYTSGNAPSYLGGALNVAGHLTGNTLGMTGAASIGGTAYVGGTLRVDGATGLGGPSAPGYALYTYTHSSLAPNVGIGLGTSAITATLDVNGSVMSRGALATNSSLTVQGSAQVVGNLTVNAYTGLQGAADSRFSLRVYGATYHDGLVGIQVVAAYPLQVGGQAFFHTQVGIGTTPVAHLSLLATGGIQCSTVYAVSSVSCASLYVSSGNNYLAGYTGIGRGAAAPWSLCAVSLYADAQIQTNELHARAGVGIRADPGGYGIYSPTGAQTYLNGLVGISWSPAAEYWLSVPSIHCDSITMSGTNYGGAIHLTGELRAVSMVLSGTGYADIFSCAQVQSGSIVLSTVGGYKPGGGAWLDSSSSILKRNIETIPDALERMLALRGRTFEWSEEVHAAALPGTQYGMVAEEVQPVMPQWVGRLEDGTLTLGPIGFEALTVESLRTVVAMIEGMQQRLDALEAH